MGNGRLVLQELPTLEAKLSEVARWNPAELLYSEDWALPAALRQRNGLCRRPPWHFEPDSARQCLLRQFNVLDLRGYGCEQLTAAVAAAGALLQYVKDTQQSALPHVQGKIGRASCRERV